MMKRMNALAGLLLLTVATQAQSADSDTLRIQRLREVAVSASPKENADHRQRAASSSLLKRTQLQARGIESLKGLETLMPNFFMPDYGSRQTSSIYIRGIGSRIGTPAVGLMVDGIPYYDKSAFDFSLCHVEQIEVARGPQSTLYGRNTMGGLVKVTTRSPFHYQGTDVHLGYATGNHQRQLSFTRYHHPSESFAFSAGGFYDGMAGFFQNDMTGNRVDRNDAGGIRLRGIYHPTHRLTFDANLHYEFSDEGAYPYYYTGVTEGEETRPEYVGRITNNLEGRYRRHLLNAGLRSEYAMEGGTLHAVTAYQHINDRMFMDQDFLWDDVYSLCQRQKIHILSQELMFKRRALHWDVTSLQWLTGANFFYQWQGVEAPVTFRRDGVAMLNGIINGQANSHMPVVASGPMTMAFRFNDRIEGDALKFDDDFRSPTLGAALFHQSDFRNIFGVMGLNATAGLRVDYEKVWFNYAAWYDFTHTYSLDGHLTMPAMERDVVMVPATTFEVSNHDLQGAVSNDYVQLLPRFSLQYLFPRGNVYASVSRGFRSGGYNAQNISELLRGQMQTDMMVQVRDVTLPVLNAQPAVPQPTKDQVAAILNGMAEGSVPDVDASCGYRPEYAWNYELGAHLDFCQQRLSCDVAAFFSDVRNLQLSQMSLTGLGRIITNAGRSRSAGVEATVKARPVNRLLLTAVYGFTHASFVDYQSLLSDGTTCDYAGNYVPYMPQHTYDVDATYAFPLRGRLWHTLRVGANLSGAGRIYWNEANTRRQDMYCLLGARLSLVSQHFDIQLWGRNLTNTHYNTFWVDSAKRGYEQHGRPSQVGVDVQLRF